MWGCGFEHFRRQIDELCSVPSLEPLLELTDEVFLKSPVRRTLDIKFESTAQGELIVVPPTRGNW